MEITKEQEEKLREAWDKYGDCNSCGWHAAYYEVSDLLEEKFLDKDFEPDGSISMPCYNSDIDEDECCSHRGTRIYDFNLP